MNATRYIEISPRGFSNETVVRTGTPAQVAAALAIINNDVNAWARQVRASDPVVRAAIRTGEAEALTEADLRNHRPELLDEEGHSRSGGQALPV